MKPKINQLINKSVVRLKRGSPTVLTCLGVAGVATTVSAVMATPKAIEKIRKDSLINHDGDPCGYSKTEAIRSAWVYYIPSTVIGVSTITCIVGANVLNRHQQASLSSAYALINKSYNEYKEKLKELYGEEAHQKIIDSIAKEHCNDVYLSGQDICGCNSLDFDEHNPDENHLFYDEYSRRYFESSVSRVLQAEYHLNRNFVMSGHLPVNDFYEMLGLSAIDGGEYVGWNCDDGLYWIDFNHRKTVMLLKWFGHQTLIGVMRKTSQWNRLFAKITATIMERRQRAMNSKIIRIIGLAATVIGLGANLINDWADEQKMNEQIDKKVNEALAKRDANAKES